MKFCILELRSVTASFRNPEFQNFHKTLHLPPPTTMVGFAGAALGLSPKAAQEWFSDGNWHLGICGVSEGYTKDLWKYRTLDSNPEKASSIILRELMFNNRFLMAFGTQEIVKAELLLTAFSSPKYALTLGTSDALVKVVSARLASEMVTRKEIANSLTAGNILSEILEKPFNGEDFSLYTTSEPIAYDLPVLFQYDSDYGIRRVVKRKTFSFIGEKMELNFEVGGVMHDGNFIPIFKLHDDGG